MNLSNTLSRSATAEHRPLLKELNPGLKQAFQYRNALDAWYARMIQAGRVGSCFDECKPDLADFCKD